MDVFSGYLVSLIFFLLSQLLHSSWTKRELEKLKQEIILLRQLLDEHKPLG